ncbi:YqcI/YcgG family protein [Metabacillus arenae]|uniref:YqcI/YcgG family protein n=1 Tax=Metabacillus arenae TaxID=2771434 RepID=A0A926NE29_9BACI|nr:YqcI/YcgG family protein [Metabacillus arenae]MBD1382552.1 YqcI/YcgG family protein [Metabacillus arenae]
MLLFDKFTIEENSEMLEKWQYDAFLHFKNKLMDDDKKFPCIPAVQGYKLNHFRFGFVSDPTKPSAHQELAQLLTLFGRKSHSFGSYTSLVIFFETTESLIGNYEIEQYRELFWGILNQLSKMDEEKWPEHIPVDPNHHIWEYCFGGEQYFMYCATPAHKNRKSRSFPYFIFAVTPRWVLERFNSFPQSAAKIKKSIRERIKAYDTVNVHPDLNGYRQENNFEWKQYFLSDDESTPSKCPFTYMKNLLRGSRY